MSIVLRPDQVALKADIYQAYNQGAIDVCGVAVTGFGKSIVSSDITLDQHNAGLLSCVLAHRTELVGQMSKHIAERGIKHRIIAPKNIVSEIIAEHRREFNGRSFVNPDANTTVAGVQTLVSRRDELAAWAAQIDFLQTDEGHHQLRHNVWGHAREMFTRARGLGVTATPARADGMGLGRHADGFYDVMCRGPNMRWLIDHSSLSDFEVVIPSTDFHLDDDALAPSGDFSPKKMAAESKRSHIVGDVVREYTRYALGKRAICFATDVEASNKIANDFNACGIPAVSLSAKTPSNVRSEFIRRFRAGIIKILVNVDLFDEGFDVPACEVVIMARPTASLGKYLQMCGRALRVFAGKLYGLIIDLVSNVIRHGLPDKEHYFSLDRRDKRAKREPDPELEELTACRGCSRPYLRYLPACPKCGWSPPLPAPGGRTIEMVDGDLMLLTRERLAEMRAATVLETPGGVGERVGAAAGAIAGKAAANHSIARWDAQGRLRAAIEQYAGVGRAKGRSDAEVMKRFYAATGVDVITCLTLPRPEMEALAAKVEGWCYA